VSSSALRCLTPSTTKCYNNTTTIWIPLCFVSTLASVLAMRLFANSSFCAYYDNDLFTLLSSSFYNYIRSLDNDLLLLVWGLCGDLPRGGIQRATLFALAMHITIRPMSIMRQGTLCRTELNQMNSHGSCAENYTVLLL
jgi:hypothetical protein